MRQDTKSIFTLTIIHNRERVLLGMKKRGFGVGKWNGFGGRVEAGESLEDSAMRELREEVGLEVKKLSRVGRLVFVLPDRELLVHVFSVREFSGAPVETEEMKPAWFPVHTIPYDEMWRDDRFWLPLVFEDRRFEGRFVFDTLERIVEHELRIIPKA